MTGLEKVTLRYISLIMKANHNLLWVEFVGGDGEERGGVIFWGREGAYNNSRYA